MKSYTLEEVNRFGHGIEVIPAIIEPDIDGVKKKFDRVYGKVYRVQIDIVDGIFADNLTASVSDLRDIDFKDVKVDVQLMTQYPMEDLGDCKSSGVDRVFGHIEQMHSQRMFVDTCNELEIVPGLALDLHTPVESLDKSLIEELDGILLMTVKAGFSGQDFVPTALDKARQLREMGYQGDIQADGGVNQKSIPMCIAAGINQLVEGSYLWKADDIEVAMDYLKSAVSEEAEY